MSNKSHAEHLQLLLEFASPKELRRSIQKTFFAFLAEQESKSLDPNYHKIVEDHFFLFDFLDKLEL